MQPHFLYNALNSHIWPRVPDRKRQRALCNMHECLVALYGKGLQVLSCEGEGATVRFAITRAKINECLTASARRDYFKAILIDDEKPALLQLERLLVADGRLEIRGKFTTFAEGMVHLAQEKADIVFLDIEMPDINGLEASEYIQQMDSANTIVFVTASLNTRLRLSRLKRLIIC
jgi:CheY-like chemotaxis protein